MINATLIVQGCHFFVGYVILKYVVLRPALRVIRVREEEESAVQHAIVLLQKKIAERVDCRTKEWHERCQAWAVERPDLRIEYSKDRHLALPTTTLSLDKNMEDKLVQEVCGAIVDHVTRSN